MSTEMHLLEVTWSIILFENILAAKACVIELDQQVYPMLSMEQNCDSNLMFSRSLRFCNLSLISNWPVKFPVQWV